MKMIRPVTVTDAVLTSNVPETDGPAYSIAATYALGTVVIDPILHLKYESLVANNLGNLLSNPAKWLALGATNRWRMFDKAGGTLTTQASPIDVTIMAPARIDGLALFGLDAQQVQVTITSVDYGVLYDRTTILRSESGITNWFSYFSEEVVFSTDLVLTDLPLTSNVAIRVQVTKPVGSVSVGTMVVGQLRDLGASLYGVKAGIADYSRKTTDDFGNTSLVERDYAKRSTFTVALPAGQSDALFALLSKYRATPVVWVGTDIYALSWIYGWARDWSVGLTQPSHSYLSIEIEGLT